jgi:hypothetical protein
MKLTTCNHSYGTFLEELQFLGLFNIFITFHAMTTLVILLFAPGVYLTFSGESHTMVLTASDLLDLHTFVCKII